MSVMYIRDKDGRLVPVKTIQGAPGENGADGISPTVSVSKSGKVTTLVVADANGTRTVEIHDGVDGVDAGTISGTASADEYTLRGQTPQTISSGSTVKLVGDTECTYYVKSHTVADFDIESGALTNAVLSKEGDRFQLKAGSGATAWYQTYIDVIAEGLVVGETYNFVFDAAGVPYQESTHQSAGHYTVHDAEGNTLITREAMHNDVVHIHEFTAPTTSVRIRWYPATNSIFAAGVSVAYVNAIYINRAGTTEHTQILNLSGTFTGTTLLGSLPGGITVDSDPASYVYLRTGSGAASAVSRHAGKMCVCFGDSVTGNMDAPYDYPSVLAEETGMEVVNAGFGGCRMSDTHPTEAYAAFSMVKLAEAVASADWTLQDEKVGDISELANASEHLAALKNTDWSSVDFVTIAYGTNDIQGGVTLDDAENPQSTTAYLGALRYAITKLLTAYPHLKVLLLTPIYRYWNDEDVDSDEKLFGGRNFTDWGDGLLGVAEEFKIPAVDMYRTLGFNAITRGHYFPSTDGTHPNTEGLKLIGGKIAAKLIAEY